MITRCQRLALCLMCTGVLLAQPPCNPDIPDAGLNCDDFGFPLCNIDDINGFCGRLPNRNPLNADEWCGDNSEVSNGSVFRFFVNSANVTVRVYWDDCGFRGEGIQAAIYEGCSDDFRFPISCVNTCFPPFSNPAEFTFTGQAGQAYALLVDGCFNNTCAYVVEIITDNPDPVILVEEWEPADQIEGPGIGNDRLCNGNTSACAQYSIVSRLAAAEYIWYLNGTLVQQNRDPVINLNNINNQLLNAELCVQGVNSCDSNEVVCTMLQVRPSTTELVDTCICPFDLNDFEFRGERFVSEVNGRIFEDVDACGCRDTTVFNLSIVEQDTLDVTYSVCVEDLATGISLPGQLDPAVVTSEEDERILYTAPTELLSCMNGNDVSCNSFTRARFALVDIEGSLPDIKLDCNAPEQELNLDSLIFYPDRNSLDLSINWSRINDGLISTDDNVLIDSEGDYELSIVYSRSDADTNFITCVFLDTFSVVLDTSLSSDALRFEVQAESCFGLNNGAVRILSDVDSLLVGIDDGPLTDTLMFENLAVGLHIIESVTEDGCRRSDTIRVLPGDSAQYNLIVSDSVFFEGQTILVSIENTNRDELFATDWSVDDRGECSPCVDLTFSPNQSQRIRVLVEDNDGCIDSAFVDIRLLSEDAVYIPNVFSRNAILPTNQSFTVFADETVESILSVQIFDRWGARVFRSQNTLPQEPLWDGTVNGENLLNGVYLYRTVVRFINGEERVYNGDVTLMN